MTTTLVRKFDSNLIGGIDGTFAAECETLLGYKRLTTVVTRERQQRVVADALREAGVTPFTRDSVERYKASKAGRPWWLLPLFVLVGGMLVVGPIWLAFALDDLFALSLSVLCLIFGVVGSGLWSSLNREWLVDNLEYHEVPEFALQTALDVSKALQRRGIEPVGTEGMDRSNIYCFQVEQLTASNTSWLDPFLVLYVGSERWYLEVWNEPGFKVRREV